MADVREADDAAALSIEVDELRLALARRRYDAYAADVLGSTLRRMLAGIGRAASRWARSTARRAVMGVAALVAPPGTRRRERLRPLAAPLRRPLATRAARPRDGGRYATYLAAARKRRRVADEPRGARDPDTWPLASVVVASRGGDLAATVATLHAQSYPRVEVIVLADRDPGIGAPVRSVVDDDVSEGGINRAVAAATGEYVVVLNAGDLLEPGALEALVAAVEHGADAAYADEDVLDESAAHVDGHLKPGTFGPETLLSYDVVGAPLLVRTALFLELGGLDAACAPAAHHDFALRLAERTDQLAHVPSVLLSRPTAARPDPAATTAATIEVVRRALARRGHNATVEVGDVLPSVRVAVEPPSPAPSVVIVIPTRDRLDLLSACVRSVERRTTYPNYSIVICDNDSVEPATLEWLEASPHRVVRCPGPFNYAAIVNRGVAHADATFVVTLNNDTTIATPDWLERLVGTCSLDSVGSVGVQLRYPDGRLQHEGVAIIPMPVHLSRDVNYECPDRWLTSMRNAGAVTGACQIVRSTVWRDVGGLDEGLAVGYNDVDFGLRLTTAGWRVVYDPSVVLGHRESATRGNLHPEADVLRLIARWDLLGSFADPSVPRAMRYVTGSIDLAGVRRSVPRPLRGPLLGAGTAADVASLEATRAELAADLAVAPGVGRTARAARRVAAEARSILDDGPPVDAMRRLAPGGSRRRRALVRVTAAALRARRGETTSRVAVRHRATRPTARPHASDVARESLEPRGDSPTVSIVVVDDGAHLDATLAAAKSQRAGHLEVLVATEGPAVGIEGVRVVARDRAAASLANVGVEAATAEYVVVLAAGDVLATHAIERLVGGLGDGVDAVYGDEEWVDELGARTDLHLKPAGFCPETLLSYDVVGAPLLVRRARFLELGGLREEAAPIAGHDLALRLAEGAGTLVHVDGVLVSHRGPAADAADAAAATVGVVGAALARRGVGATVSRGDVLPSVRVRVHPPDPVPSVAIVIPTRDRLELLEACVASVEQRTSYPRYSIVICDNDSIEPATRKWMDASPHLVVPCPGPFNYSSIVNRGVARADAEFVVTLNNDTTVATPDWLERLVGLCSLEGVGSVGTRLLLPDGTVQHEGVAMVPLPVPLSRDRNYEVVDRWLGSMRNAMAVTGACQIVRTEAWQCVDGLDEQLAVAFNDVDFGIRLCRAGWRVLYTPDVVLGHRESASRGELHPLEDEALLVERWDLRGSFVDTSIAPSRLGPDGWVALVESR